MNDNPSHSYTEGAEVPKKEPSMTYKTIAKWQHQIIVNVMKGDSSDLREYAKWVLDDPKALKLMQ